MHPCCQTEGRSSDTGGVVLDLLKLMEKFLGRTKEDGGTLIKTYVTRALNLGRGTCGAVSGVVSFGLQLWNPREEPQTIQWNPDLRLPQYNEVYQVYT